MSWKISRQGNTYRIELYRISDAKFMKEESAKNRVVTVKMYCVGNFIVNKPACCAAGLLETTTSNHFHGSHKIR